MSRDKRKAAVAIGVSDAPPLPFLGGAVNGARTFVEWAQAQGYATRLVIDETEPVTVPRVRQELEGLLAPDLPAIHRLLIYFAGHGVIREVEEGLWLLSDWNHELRAVAVEALRRRLCLYRVGQVAIFADACRSLPADVDTAGLVPEAVLGRGPGPRSTTVAIDKFVAAQDGTRTFMIPGPSSDEDRCLFSGVLLEGLWGTKRGALSTVLPGKVTSRSLGAFLQAEASGTVAATTALPDFIASIVVTERGMAALVYREVHAPRDAGSLTEDAIGSLERGSLRADAVSDLAVALRQGKHADPVRGVIAAYLYDSIGDVDSIPRMACFYVMHGQPIPYDIALLAQRRALDPWDQGSVRPLHRGLPPALHVQHDPFLVGVMRDRLQHEVPWNGVKEGPDVKIDNPVLPEAPLSADRDRVHGRAPGR